jgi:hypothetical protein
MTARGSSWLGLLVLMACAPVVIAKNDWSTKYRGAGSVETRVWNQSPEPITVRIEDYYGTTVAQVPLEPNGRESIFLPTGNVRAVVYVVRNGVPSTSTGANYNVAGETIGAEWRFFPPR